MTRTLLVAAIAAVAAAAAIAANVLLLGSAAATNDPVGQLNSRVHLPAAPHWTVRPGDGHPHDEHADD
jgi:predicted porin